MGRIFSPSPYSDYGEGETVTSSGGSSTGGSSTDWAALAQAGSSIATAFIGSRGASKQAESQQAHDLAMEKKRGSLLGLEAEASGAEAALIEAQAALQKFATTRTLFVVLGSVAVVSILAVTVQMLRR